MRPYPILRVFLVVSAGAMFGMVLGGIFGRWAGGIAPHFFAEMFQGKHENLPDPVGTGTFLGATAGVLCGGGLGAFAYTVHVAMEWITSKKVKAAS